MQGRQAHEQRVHPGRREQRGARGGMGLARYCYAVRSSLGQKFKGVVKEVGAKLGKVAKAVQEQCCRYRQAVESEAKAVRGELVAGWRSAHATTVTQGAMNNKYKGQKVS